MHLTIQFLCFSLFAMHFLLFKPFVRLFFQHTFFFLQNWATFLLFFQFPLLTRRNSPFHNISTIYGSNTFCSPARSPLNYCLPNVTFLPLSAKVLIHHHLRLLPNINPAPSHFIWAQLNVICGEYFSYFSSGLIYSNLISDHRPVWHIAMCATMQCVVVVTPPPLSFPLEPPPGTWATFLYCTQEEICGRKYFSRVIPALIYGRTASNIFCGKPHLLIVFTIYQEPAFAFWT